MPTASQALQRFNRTFHWCLKAPRRMTFHVAFGKVGLTQISPQDTCPDQHTYNLVALETTKNVHLGSFCVGGSVKGVQILNGGKVTLRVPGSETLVPQTFDVVWGEDIKSLAVVQVSLPKGQSSQEFYSPNYPRSFPDDDLITWDFNIPRYHDATVKFLHQAEPRCRKKEPGVEYEHEGVTVVKKLSDPQPSSQQGSFLLTLRNCEMDIVRSLAEARGLALHFRVSAVRTGSEVLCNVDLTQEDSLSLHIAKRDKDSSCKLKLNGSTKESLSALPGKKSVLSFKDCPEEELLLTVNKTIGCKRLQDCPRSPVPLTVPLLERCLPESLTTLHWNLLAPTRGTVELWAYAGTLRQSLPEQECNGTVQFHVAESDGTALGQFCPGGIISEVQVHGNVTVTATPRDEPFLSLPFQTFFKVSFAREIGETYIFTISPKKEETNLLATPGWPAGMRASTSASWIASLPERQEAHLVFRQVSQPKCAERHTAIQVRTLGSEEEMYSRREDEEGDSEIVVPESFYLNMSNCRPERGSFSVMGEVTLKPKRRIILPIILGIVGFLLIGMIIALVTVCVVIRKKKKELSHPVSVYNPNGHSFLPGLHGPPKTPDDDDHIYDYIEDTLVYGHLLRDDIEMDDMDAPKPSQDAPKNLSAFNGDKIGVGVEVGVYRPFIPPSDVALSPQNRAPIPENGEVSSTEKTLVENEIYSSKEDHDEGPSTPPPLSPCSESLLGPVV